MTNYQRRMKMKVAIRLKRGLLARLKGKVVKNTFGAEAVFWKDVKEAIRIEVRRYAKKKED